MWVNIPNMDGMGIYVLIFDLDTRPFNLNAVVQVVEYHDLPLKSHTCHDEKL